MTARKLNKIPPQPRPRPKDQWKDRDERGGERIVTVVEIKRGSVIRRGASKGVEFVTIASPGRRVQSKVQLPMFLKRFAFVCSGDTAPTPVIERTVWTSKDDKIATVLCVDSERMKPRYVTFRDADTNEWIVLEIDVFRATYRMLDASASGHSEIGERPVSDKMVTCPDCGHEQEDMGKNVACEGIVDEESGATCGAAMPTHAK